MGFGRVVEGSWGDLGGLLKALGRLLGWSWGLLGGLWGRIWGLLGASRGSLWKSVGALEEVLVRLWRATKNHQKPLVLSIVFGGFCVSKRGLGRVLGALGRSWGASGAFLGDLGWV